MVNKSRAKSSIKALIIIAVVIAAAVVISILYWNSWSVEPEISAGLMDKAETHRPNWLGESVSVGGHEFVPQFVMRVNDVNGVTDWEAVVQIVDDWNENAPITVPPITITGLEFAFEPDGNTELRYKEGVRSGKTFDVVDGRYTVSVDEIEPLVSVVRPDYVLLAMRAATIDYDRDINAPARGTAYASFTLSCGSYSKDYECSVPIEYVSNAHYWE